MAKGTVAQKIIDIHHVYGDKKPGSQISIRIDQTLTQDATGTMAYLELEAIGVDRVKTELSVSYVDHNMMQNGPENRNDHLYLQTIAAAKGVYFSRPGNGICHQIHLERFGIPGKTLLGSDSHTPTNGGIGMLAIGAGGLDVALAMAGRPFRLSYPEIIGVELIGKLKPWVAPKDIIFKMLEILTTKGNVGCIVEYFGAGLGGLSVPDRATITNMGAELGVTSSIFPSDEKTKAFLKAEKRGKSWKELKADPDAEYDRIIKINLEELVPLAACPSSPDNIKSINDLEGIKVDQVIIGSCTNSSYQDMMLIAKMLKGRTVHKNVSLSIAPGSRQVMETLAGNKALADIIASGARILESGCGPCIGQGMSPASDTVTLRTFNRNFPGRTGTKNDKAYLVSPAVAATAALTGEITNPERLGIEYPEIPEAGKLIINDSMIIPPPPPGEKIEIIRKPTVGTPPKNLPLPECIRGVVVIKVGDKITTDHIMPAGIHLKHRSNIPVYAKVVFECFNENGKPGFAERAAQIRDSGKHGVIVARESYGQGSSREHAAICPMFLGVKAVVAVSIERIHAANLINFGIVPLLFANSADYEKILEGDKIEIREIRGNLQPGKILTAKIRTQNDIESEILLKNSLSEEDIKIILAGGCLNYI